MNFSNDDMYAYTLNIVDKFGETGSFGGKMSDSEEVGKFCQKNHLVAFAIVRVPKNCSS